MNVSFPLVAVPTARERLSLGAGNSTERHFPDSNEILQVTAGRHSRYSRGAITDADVQTVPEVCQALGYGVQWQSYHLGRQSLVFRLLQHLYTV